MYSGDLFALDGALADSAPDLVMAVNHALAAFDCEPVAVDKARRWVGRGSQVLLDKAFAA